MRDRRIWIGSGWIDLLEFIHFLETFRVGSSYLLVDEMIVKYVTAFGTNINVLQSSAREDHYRRNRDSRRILHVVHSVHHCIERGW